MINSLARLSTWAGTRRRPSVPRFTPKYYGLQYEDVRFPSAHSDGVSLSGWLIPAPQSRGAIILCHGHTSTRMHLLPKAVMLYGHHFTTLLFDFRARGLSGGERCTLGARETEDVLGAVAYLRSRPDTAAIPLGALGESMGGAAVIRAAACSQEIDCIVTEAAYASLDRVVKQRLVMALGPMGSPVFASCQRMSAEEFELEIETISPERVIGSLAPRAALLITDGLDLTCPRRESDRLYAAAGEPKMRWIAPTAPHCMAFQTAREEYSRRVSQFFTEHLAPKS